MKHLLIFWSLVFFTTMGIVALGEQQDGGATHIQQRSMEAGGSQINSTETYRANDPRLLRDFLNDHPDISQQLPNGVEVGRDNSFKVIVQSQDNKASQVNLNLYVTVDKGYVQLTAEQKRSLSLDSIQRRLVQPISTQGKPALRFNLDGIRLAENRFVRVTRDPDYGFREDDEYYFVAAPGTLKGEVAAVERVDPINLVVRPGTDEELKHFGIVPPKPADYLARVGVQVANYPAYFPATRAKVDAVNRERDARSEQRWKRFEQELLDERRVLKLPDSSQILKPELYLRYHHHALASREIIEPPYEMGTDEYLAHEWNISVPVYQALQRVSNPPRDFAIAFAGYNQRLGQLNATTTADNQKRWQTYWTQLAKVNLPQDIYAKYYWRWVYDERKASALWADVQPGVNDLDPRQSRGTESKLRAHGIALPQWAAIGEGPSVTEQAPGRWVYDSYRDVYGGVLSVPRLEQPAPQTRSLLPSRERERLREHNAAARAHNREQWSSFIDSLKMADIPVREYVGQRVGGVLLKHPEDLNLQQEGLLFHFTADMRLPEIGPTAPAAPYSLAPQIPAPPAPPGYPLAPAAPLVAPPPPY